MTEVSTHDRELVAAEYDAEGMPWTADMARSDCAYHLPTRVALRAIAQARMEEREAVVRWLMRGVSIDPEGKSHVWDREMSGYAQHFASCVQKGDHLPSNKERT